MKKLLVVAVLLIAALQVAQYAGLLPDAAERSSPPANPVSAQSAPRVEHSDGDAPISQAFADGRSNVQVEAEGRVSRVLEDDNDGSRHQRFIVRLDSGQTVLIAHNIDLAPRITGLREGDAVSFYGEYEWNSKGGVIHWTHADPRGQHPAGWIRHNGRIYQ
jgi:Protein of unknown function (DUF3465)